ncbi:MAG: 23S rRNA (adenine(2503)-C(2))-methyltransferase RlmN [Treponema sp.]|nr:23S rRNA (adenine(2503)-C(2))-methyltransferase RlmN [Treponema sp.]
MPESSVPVLSGMSLEELTGLVSPQPRFRAMQVFKWIASGVSTFDQMGNLPLPLRQEFAACCLLRPRTTVTRHRGSDGTVKLAVELADGTCIEAVLLADTSAPNSKAPDSGASASGTRYTACLSTQVGCPAGCVFCKTGSMGFVRNLDSAEIIEQFLLLRAEAESLSPKAPAPKGSPAELPVSNIVVMGMGEPLLNLGPLRKAVSVIGDSRGIGFSHRRITVSTCGVSAGIADLADNGPPVRLALSLTTADESLRRRLMPFTEKQPLGEVKDALLRFQRQGGGRVTLEAVLLGGINTRAKDARDMAGFARGLDATVNLIPWNPVKGLEFEGRALREPAVAEVESFSRQLKALGLNVTRRFRRGRGVMGACGQLGGYHPLA